MPTNKQEIIRQVNRMIARLKNQTYTSVSSLNADFADVFIEGFSGGKRDERKSERIKPAEKIRPVRPNDPVPNKFAQMRRLSKTFHHKVIYADAYREQLFYKQAVFMADFEDDYPGFAPFQMYYPNYQMMNDEQLRTYFTWRSKVRMGNTDKTDLSYVFLYIYELINNIGVSDGNDGIIRLLSLWKAYRQYTPKLDKYMAAWIRDYFVLNNCGFSFQELLCKEPLLMKYYTPDTDKYTLDYYNRISFYKIKDSIFFTPENEKMLSDCFGYIVDRLNTLLGGANINRKFNDLIMDRGIESIWFPFSKAIFCMRPGYYPKGPVVIELSDEMIYRYRNGRWTYIRGGLYTENGKQIVSYIFRRMEQLLRRAKKFKYRLSADDKHIDKHQLDRLLPGIGSKGFLSEIDLAIKEYYINSKRTVVKVDLKNLEIIRENALITQEKLIVSEDSGPGADFDDGYTGSGTGVYMPRETQTEYSSVPAADENEESVHDKQAEFELEHSCALGPGEETDAWAAFIVSLEPVELTALIKILEGAPVKSMHEYARDSGLMLEVLLDSINQKALDFAGDTILELTDEVTIFDDYMEDLRKAVKCE